VAYTRKGIKRNKERGTKEEREKRETSITAWPLVVIPGGVLHHAVMPLGPCM
jgi:hypothetical protein